MSSDNISIDDTEFVEFLHFILENFSPQEKPSAA